MLIRDGFWKGKRLSLGGAYTVAGMGVDSLAADTGISLTITTGNLFTISFGCWGIIVEAPSRAIRVNAFLLNESQLCEYLTSLNSTILVR
jgi:hypothetical protein